LRLIHFPIPNILSNFEQVGFKAINVKLGLIAPYGSQKIHPHAALLTRTRGIPAIDLPSVSVRAPNLRDFSSPGWRRRIPALVNAPKDRRRDRKDIGGAATRILHVRDKSVNERLI